MFPKLINFGSFYLPTYGVLVATGFLVGLAVVAKLAKKAGLSHEKITNLAVYAALAGLLGAKLTMFLFDWEIYAKNPGELFSIATLQSAGVYQGGLLVAFLAAGLLIRAYKLPPLLTLDCFAPGLALGHAIGRLGCFAAGCCWGAVCERPWAVTFKNPDAHEITGVPLDVPLHPTQLYESAAEFVIAYALWRLFQRRPNEGTVMGLYLVAYSTVRFFVEFLRFHQQALPFGGPFSNTQWISLAMALVGLAMLTRLYPKTILTSSKTS